MLTHLSLFTGIGGIDLAAEWAGFETVGQCEWADYPTKVLEKHWPTVPRWRDVHELTSRSFYARTGLATVDLISGGVPCQPASCAGKRRGKSDDRWLWPEAFRVIRELKPPWCVLENVSGLITLEQGLVFESLLSDLEDQGYEVQAFLIPACGVDAPHRRERVFIVANTDQHTDQGAVCGSDEETGGVQEKHRSKYDCSWKFGRAGCMVGYRGSDTDTSDYVAYTDCIRRYIRSETRRSVGDIHRRYGETKAQNANGQECLNGFRQDGGTRFMADGCSQNAEYSEPGVGELVNGVSRILDGGIKNESLYAQQGKKTSAEGDKSRDLSEVRLDMEGTKASSGHNKTIGSRDTMPEMSCGCRQEIGEVGAREQENTDMLSLQQGVYAEMLSRSQDLQPGMLERNRPIECFEKMEKSIWADEPDIPRVATGIKDRVNRLKCLGNAVVPQQVYPILKAIADVIKSNL